MAPFRRSSWPPTPPWTARPPPAGWPASSSPSASAPPASGWASRSAATSNTPTSSRWTAPWKGGGRSVERLVPHAHVAPGPGLAGQALIGLGLEHVQHAGLADALLAQVLGALDHGDEAGAAAGVPPAAVRQRHSRPGAGGQQG